MRAPSPPGRTSLRLDAVYCALVAVLVLVFAGPLSEQLDGAPLAVLYTVGAATAGWAAHLWFLSRRARRSALVLVLVANSAGAALIGMLALTRPLDAFSILLGAVAVEVAAFAVSQGVALRARPA